MIDTLALNGDWTLFQALGSNQIPATVPGSVLGDLLANELIPDPFFRENEYAALRLFDEDYTYQRSFDVPDTMLQRVHIELVFLGLDTLATVTLNGQIILEADNMHRTWRVDVKPFIQASGNLVSILFHSPNRFIADASKNNPDITYDGTGYTMGSNFLRKAHCMFGWDWGPQLPDAGIWRPCQLEAYDALRIESIDICQHHIDHQVQLDVSVQLQGNASTKLRVSLTAPGGEISMYHSVGNQLSLVIQAPALWQPHGWGEQPLYTLHIACLDAQDAVLDETTRRIGLRTIAISQQPDAWGREFCFVVNGNKLFSMGADYIPEDNLLGRTNPQRTRKLLEDCVKANFNTVRVWGGGYYPEDWFFDQCDELGLIVWMDLMYACNIYKLTDDFEQNILAETRDNLLRIRHHACLGLVCGNNEMESAWVDWPGICKHSMALRADYIKQFEYVLKKECESLVPQCFYWPSSPSSGGSFDDPNSYDRGDVHCWDVWHGLLPFEAYREKYPRFCSEFGFESFPSMKTIETFTDPQDRNIFSRVLESHQKCVGGNGKIMYYISQNFKYPLTFAHVLYASQLLQAEAMRAGVEHWRRNRGRCMGAIYWQLNDCWPVASWASIDSHGRWKQLHYAAAKFFAPLLISCERKNFDVRISVANDTLADFAGTAELMWIKPDGTVLHQENISVDVPSLTASWIYNGTYIPKQEVLHPEDSLALITRLRDSHGTLISDNCELFTPSKYFAFEAPEITTVITQVGADCHITLNSRCFAWGVWLDTTEQDCPLSDNGFSLLPDEPKTIVAGNISKDVLQNQLQCISIADLGK